MKNIDLKAKTINIGFLQKYSILYTHSKKRQKNTLINSLRKKRSYGNLTKKELGFMEQLKTPGDIIITSTVKAGPQLVKMLNNILE